MSNDLRYDGKVAIVTGAGNGLGKTYALALAARGAKVVVNDLGGSMTGEGKDSRAADLVVSEIKAAGGQAVASYDSTVDGAKIVKTAIDAFGSCDIVICNAGILRDVSFIKMKDSDWDILYAVHLKGSFAVAHAAWPYMKDKKYGRIILVASGAGIYGNFGQANYSAMKMGLVGLSNTLSKEGAKLGIHCNTIAPLAGSRLTETVMPPDLVKALKPEFVSPVVLYLCHESSKENGGLFELGAGWVAKLRWQRSKGAFFPVAGGKSFSVEDVKSRFTEIEDFSEASYPVGPNDAFPSIMANLDGTAAPAAGAKTEGPIGKKPAAKGAAAAAGGKKNDAVDLSKALGYEMPPVPYSYTDRDVSLYALGVGTSALGPFDDELRFTYENHEQFSALPTFGVIPPSGVLAGVMSVPGLTFNPMMLLHGEQYLEVRNRIPTSGTLTSYAKVANIYDKTSGALVVLDSVTKDESGKEIFFNQYSLFIRGLGGFGGDKGPKATDDTDAPNRAPDVVHREQTLDSQALLYRLSGDRNPLHADPAMAAMGQFPKPILHGLCSFGYAVRAVLRHFCGYDTTKFKSVKVRFVKHVFPGETLITEMWAVTPTRIHFRVKVAERGEYVLSNCVVTLVGDDSKSAAAPAAAAAKSAAPKAAAAKPAPAKPAAAAASAGSGGSGGAFAAEAVFASLSKQITADIVKQVQGTFRFDLTNGSAKRSWFVDLKSGAGSVSEIKSADGPKADCTLTLKDSDFVLLMNGQLQAQQAFMKGQLKIGGNMQTAMKLSVLTKARSKL